MVVIPERYSANVLSEEKGTLIKKKLFNAIDDISYGEIAPRFYGVTFKDGLRVIEGS